MNQGSRQIGNIVTGNAPRKKTRAAPARRLPAVERKDHLLDVARSILLEEGVRALTMERLACRRAEAVRDYMVSEGIARSAIKVSGEGETNPVASNASAEGRAQNRRVDIHVGVRQSAT